MAVLEVNNLQKCFGSTDVLKGVSFSLERGQVLAIIGSSGSGKTTLLRCLNFLETPDAGEICVNGIPLTGSHLSGVENGAAVCDQINRVAFCFGIRKSLQSINEVLCRSRTHLRDQRFLPHGYRN